jgi:hypothetical protein
MSILRKTKMTAIKYCLPPRIERRWDLYDRTEPIRTPPKRCGIYALFMDAEIVYIGQSVDVDSRVWTHYMQGAKKFTSFTFIPCPPDRLDDTEKAYICAYHPLYNVTPLFTVYRVKNLIKAMRKFGAPKDLATTFAESYRTTFMLMGLSAVYLIGKWNEQHPDYAINLLEIDARKGRW